MIDSQLDFCFSSIIILFEQILIISLAYLSFVIDEGNIEGRRGSLNMDDEAEKTQRNILIENGKLIKFMHDRLSAKLTRNTPTGNGRRESYMYAPMPRMTNTFMMNGKHTRDEMIKSVKYGIYVEILLL